MLQSELAILIVDDKPANLVALKNNLIETEAKVVEAQSGKQALAATLHEDFALAIIDVQMPGMDGYELAELLRGNPETRSIPIIFLTADYSEDWQIFKGYESGAVDYIVKPYNPGILLSKVRIFLDMHAQRREIECTRDALKKSEDELASKVEELSNALKEVKTLRGILPICAYCKQIRDDEGYWHQVEAYIRDHSEAEFSHSICPKCMKKNYPDLVKNTD